MPTPIVFDPAVGPQFVKYARLEAACPLAVANPLDEEARRYFMMSLRPTLGDRVEAKLNSCA